MARSSSPLNILPEQPFNLNRHTVVQSTATGRYPESAAVANATTQAMAFQTRDPEASYYKNNRWKTAFIGGDYHWLIDGGVGGRNLDAHSTIFYQAIVNTPAMVWKIPGKGSQYAYTEHDSGGNVLDGAKSYRLHIPPEKRRIGYNLFRVRGGVRSCACMGCLSRGSTRHGGQARLMC